MTAPFRRRTRDQLVADALITLRSPLTYGSKYALLDNICWSWSELAGTYHGCRWWSREAHAGTHPLCPVSGGGACAGGSERQGIAGYHAIVGSTKEEEHNGHRWSADPDGHLAPAAFSSCQGLPETFARHE